MNWEQWEKAKQLMDDADVTALLGVIPDCQDPDLMIDNPRQDFWEYIKDLQNKGFTIAMHGYQHVFDIRAKGLVTPVKHSEFAGHPYEVQYEKIRRGKEILQKHGISTDVFFAPAHSYDDNTLKALNVNGFRFISDGKSRKPYIRNGIICIPARSGGIPKMRTPGYYTAILHAHEWIRKDKSEDKKCFENLLKNNMVCFMPFDNFKERHVGNQYIQRFSEIRCLLWQRKILPILVEIKHMLYDVL